MKTYVDEAAAFMHELKNVISHTREEGLPLKQIILDEEEANLFSQSVVLYDSRSLDNGVVWRGVKIKRERQ